MRAVICGIARGEIFEADFTEYFDMHDVVKRLRDILKQNPDNWFTPMEECISEMIDPTAVSIMEGYVKPERFIAALDATNNMSVSVMVGTDEVVMFVEGCYLQFDELEKARLEKALQMLIAGNRDDAFTRKADLMSGSELPK